MSDHDSETITQQIANVLRLHGDLDNADYLAEKVVSVLHRSYDCPRTHLDDLGRRWEWCGGTPDTWAWRVTAVNGSRQ